MPIQKVKLFAGAKPKWLLALVTVLICGMSSAAEPIKPPFEGSLKERYAIVAAKHIPDNDQSDSFKIKKVLWDPRNQVNQNDDVIISNFSHLNGNIPSNNKRQVDCHILVISRFRKHPMFRDQIEDNPDGMTIQQLPAVGPGVFNCSDEVIRIYDAVIDTDQDSSKSALITDLLTLVESEDMQSHRLASFQLAMHGDWMGQASQKNVDNLQSILAKNTLPHEATEMLIQASRGLSEQQYQGWFRDYLLSVLKNNPSSFDLGSFTPLLVRSSLLILRDMSLAEKSDWELIMPFIYSNAPGVSKAVILVLNDLDSERFNSESEALLTDETKSGQLHTETRRALTAHLRQVSAL